MAIVISGVNNNDKITATDGLIDLLSTVSFASTVTAPAFTASGNITAASINVGNNIQLGNAGVVTATTFVGNLTGNVNNTGNLLLQIGGSEKFRIGGSGQLGIGGANYGTSGQVLTSGGSGSAATWSTVSGTTINNNADNRLITGSGSANTLEGEVNLTWNGQTLEAYNLSGPSYIAAKSNTNSGDYGIVQVQSGSTVRGRLVSDASVDAFRLDTAGRASAPITFHTGSSYTERVRIDSAGTMGLGVTPKSGQYSGYNHLQVGESATLSSNDTQSDTNVTNLTQNVYLNANASAWKYLHTDEASKYEQSGGAHSFFVAASGSADATVSFNRKLRIDSDGLKFNADTSSANALDDYEEGSFTPTYTNTGGVTPNYNYQEGFYTKIGNLVTCAGIIGCTNANSFGSGKVLKIVLPFTCANNSYGLAGGGIADGSGFQNVFSGNQSAGVLIGGNTNTGRIVTLGSSPSNVYYTGSPGLQNSHYFRFRYIYHVS